MFLGIVCAIIIIVCAIMFAVSVSKSTETETTEEDRLMDGLYESGHYVMDCKIIAVNNVEGNTVCTVKGAQDYLYGFYGIGYTEGNVVKCVFWKGNDPESCMDDELVDIWGLVERK